MRGTLQLTNLAPRRPDNVNCPTLRGLLTTDDGAKAYVEMNGPANLRASDNARVFATCRDVGFQLKLLAVANGWDQMYTSRYTFAAAQSFTPAHAAALLSKQSQFKMVVLYVDAQ